MILRPSAKLPFSMLAAVLPAALLAVLALVAACTGDGRPTLVIAVQPTATQEELSGQASELEGFIEDRVDADVVLRFPTSYAGVIEALRFGHADAAFMGAWPAALANQHAEAEVVLAEVREVIIGEEKTEEPFYFSYWVVAQDSPYLSIEDLRGKKVAFPSQISTSGYVAPMARLLELGLISTEQGETPDPNEFFSETFFAGGYSQAWEALKAGQVDASIIAGDVPEELYREVLANTRVIEQQGPIPSHAVVFSKELKDPLRTDLLEALMELGDPDHRDLMRRFVSGIFVRFEPATTDEHLSSLIEYLDATGFAFTEQIRPKNAGPSQSSSRPVPEADPDPEPEAGAVQPKPAGAAQVNVNLREWGITPDQNEVSAGPVYFLVTNAGKDPHEFVVIRTDADPHDLPVVDGRVPEDEVDFIGEIEPFAGGSQASITLNLTPGTYALICNIAEFEADEGEIESHYQLGMAAAFTVE